MKKYIPPHFIGFWYQNQTNLINENCWPQSLTNINANILKEMLAYLIRQQFIKRPNGAHPSSARLVNIWESINLINYTNRPAIKTMWSSQDTEKALDKNPTFILNFKKMLTRNKSNFLSLVKASTKPHSSHHTLW